MRVLALSNLDSTRPFGQYTRPFHLSRFLAARGVDVATVAVDCRDVDFGPSWSTGVQSSRRLAGALRTACRTFRPDVIWAHQNMPAAVAVATQRGVPVAADMHSIPSADWRVFAALTPSRAEAVRCHTRALRAAAVESLVTRRADLVVAAGRSVADHLTDRYRMRRPPAVIVNGIEPSLLDAPEPPRPAAFGGAGPHVMTTLPVQSSPANERALAMLLDSAVELERRMPSVEIHVLGANAGPAAPGVRYHGLVPEVLPYLHHADACLLPLPPLSGEFGGARNKLLDALARGRTVLTTEEGLAGLEDAATWPGVVVAPHDPLGFAAALGAALSANGNGYKSRASQVQRLRWDVLAGELETVLGDVAGAGAHPR